MRGLLSIARREVHERRMVLAAAIVAGLLPFASPLVPGVSAERAVEAREVMAVVLALGFGLVLALLLGATAIARDLAENRLGFDFARPVGGLAIWGGRLGAAVGLTIAAMVIVAAPAALVAGRLRILDRAGSRWQVWLAVLGAVLLAVALAHAVSVAVRSRSRWLALDLVGLVVVLLLAVSGIRRMHEAFAVYTAVVATALAIVAAIPILWIASALQVVRGRTDIVLGHRTQSLALWSMLLVVAMGIVGYSLWLVRAEVSDLEAAWAAPAPAGSFIEVAGLTPGREIQTDFLLDVETGRSLRLGTTNWTENGSTLFSRDGRRAVTARLGSASDPTIEVSTIDLDASTLEVRATQIGFTAGEPIRPALSPTGRRLATLQGRSLSVHDLDSGRILATAALDIIDEGAWRRVRIAFVDEDRVRVYTLAGRLVAHELDVPGRKVSTWTGPEIGGEAPVLLWGPDHERLILEAPWPLGTVLLDGRNGASLAQLAQPAQLDDRDAKVTSRSSFLADGRIVRVGGISAGRASLDLHSPDGERLRSVDLGPIDSATRFALGAEVAPGTIAIARGSRGLSPWSDSGRLMLVDLDSGRIREVEGGGIPVAAMHWSLTEFRESFPTPPGSVASRLVARDRAVWLLDPDSATVRLVAGLPG